MKSFIALFVAIATVIGSLVLSPAAAAKETPAKESSSMLSLIPSSIIVQQNAILSDGRGITLYYKKSGDYCEVYSDDNLSGYTVHDLLKLDSTDFKLTTSTKGKLVYRTTTAKARALVKSLVNRYL